MKTDLYTKIVLTVIAVCLVVIAFRSTPSVKASFTEATKVDIVAIGGNRVYQGALPVEVK